MLKVKYLIVWLAALAIAVVSVNLWGSTILLNRRLDTAKANLYTEAETIARDYLKNGNIGSFTGTADETSAADSRLTEQFSALQTLTGMRVWVVSAGGEILIDSDTESSAAGANINTADDSFLSNQSGVGKSPAGLITEETISVVCPVTQTLKTVGYVVLLTPLETVRADVKSTAEVMTAALSVSAVSLALLLILLYVCSTRPLKSLAKTTREYADGHFNYPLPKLNDRSHKDLGDAIACLSDQLNGLTEYQKNFIANISHDFRSPLTNITGYTQALSDGTIPPEMREETLNIILSEAERLNKLTANLLELNRLDHKNMVLEKTAFDINEAVKTAAAAFAQQCKRKHILIELKFEEKTLTVWADAGRVGQVIQNLLDNAIKFSGSGAVVEVRTTRRAGKVLISVKDHGCGIPKESIPKIWSRFYKTDNSRGKNKTGTGLGLSITKEIIDAHGENINVISTEGVGTEFLFTLPVRNVNPKD